MAHPSTSITGARPLRHLLAALAVLALTAAAACGSAGGSGESTAAPSSAGAASSAPAGAFPVKVEHLYGTTEITKKPERIVTFGLSDHEPVLALGHKPIGVVDWFQRSPFTDWPWAKQAWGGAEPTVLGLREDGVKFEKLVALKPDLIFAMYSGIQKEHYDQLSKIAPVVAQPKGYDPYAAPWQDITRLAGRALGEEAKAEQLIAGIGERFAQVRKDNPQWAGKTAVAADSFKPGQYSAFQKGDPKSAFLAELGFTIPEEITKQAGASNVAEFGSEGLNMLEVDRLVWLTTGKEPWERIKNDKVYKELKVAKEGRDLFLTYQDPPIGAALSFNTVLSIPYAVEQVVPLLKK
ncbi:iron-siderophore ABC transporter substrate-binding protein [Planomonospora sp. ID67723]|uniref:iron-siderophore ABC transporter substrate-binding protein n=1 Tax=Planomonospora sp. ID67723 TaxID=2738134 RepID=UPI0018C3C6EF|nr:iron-siderophore ABC transporter substrate-binding protein [Planomonospora sp. ID67723]MBG0830162.1 iron-siderophore ABC transporter substrate-binding protein [Planomonospora sp. ID67723]